MYDGENITPPWGGFPSSIARQPKKGGQYRTIRLRKALGEMFPTPTVLAPTLSYCGDIEHGKSAQGSMICTVVIYTGTLLILLLIGSTRMICTVVLYTGTLLILLAMKRTRSSKRVRDTTVQQKKRTCCYYCCCRCYCCSLTYTSSNNSCDSVQTQETT